MQDGFLHMPYEKASEFWPSVSERVFEVGQELTPAQLRFEIDRIGLDFNMSREVDRDTFTIISTVLGAALDEQNILLTGGDVQYAYVRFSHLLWLYEIEKQGIYSTSMINGEIHYEPKVAMPKPEVQTHFVAPNLTRFYSK